MKIVLDTIYTNVPAKCASTIKMKHIVQHLMAKRKDIFFYWLVPDWADEEELSFFVQSPNVRLIKYPFSKDRYREYNRIDRQYEALLNFQGELWDFDMVITNRTSMIPFIKSIMYRPGSNTRWAKKVFLIEDMPIMDFKLTVGVSHPRSQELMTTAGYLAADMTAISAFWEKDIVLNEMKSYYAPAAIEYVRKTMIESSPMVVEKVGIKAKADIMAMLEKKRPFTIGWVGRMTHGTRSEDIFQLMGKHWVFRHNKDKSIRCLAFTNSLQRGRVKVPEWVDLKQLPREQFWDAVRKEMDVYLFLATEEDYSMSLMEPLILGCPAILIRAHWSVPTVGEDYPFFVNNDREAYAMVRKFYDDYPTNYKKFVEWSKASLEPLLKKRNEVYVGKLVETLADSIDQDRVGNIKLQPSIQNNQIVDMLDKYARKHGGQLTVFEAIEGMSKDLRSLHQKVTDPTFSERVKLTWGTEWNRFRLGLMARGYVDASVKTGHMQLKKGE